MSFFRRKPAPSGSELVQRSMLREAKAFVEYMAGKRGPLPNDVLDFSRSSLRAVDEFLNTFFVKHEALPLAVHGQVSAYVFEVLRNEFGGRYLAGNAENPYVLVIGEPDFQIGVMVIQKVAGRVENGPEDDLTFFTDAIPALIAAKTSTTLI